MANTARVTVEIVADAKRLKSGLGEAERATGGFGDKLDKASKGAAIALAGIGAAAIAAGKAAAEDAQSQAVLANALRNAAGANDAAIAKTEEWIAAQGKALGVADDQLRPALAQLTRATGDVGKAQQLAALAMDISAGTGKDLSTVTTALAKAQNGNLGALNKLGAGIDQATIKSGNLDGAMSQLAGKFAGAATTSANSAAGQMQRVQLAMGEAQEAIGAGLLPVMERFLPVLQRAAEWIGNNTDTVTALIAVVTAGAAAIIGINTAVKVYTATTKAITSAKKIWAAAQLKLNVALAANPIGIVIMAIVALVAIVVLAYKKSETFRNIVDAIGRVLRTYVITAFNTYKAAIQYVIEKVVTLWTKTKGLRDALSSIAKTISGTVSAAFNAIKSTIQTVIDKVAALWSKFVDVKNKIGAGIDAITPWSAAPLAAGVGTYAGGGRSSRSAAAPLIIVNGAIDPSSVAKQIKKLLAAEDQRSGNVNSQAWSAW